MLCEKCGTQNVEGAGFCEKCGAALNGGTGAGKKKSGWLGKVILILMLLIGAYAIYTAVVWSGVLGGGSPEAAAEKTIATIFSGDTKALVDQFPSKLVKAALEDGGYQSKSELAGELESQFGSIAALCEGTGVRFSVKSTGKTVGVSVADALQSAKSFYEELGMQVTSYAYVNVDVTATVNGTESTRSLYVPVAKIDGAWYVDFNEFSMRDIYNAIG